MKNKNGWFLGCGIAFLLFLIFFEPSYGWRLRQWLSPQNVSQADPNSVSAENVTLKAQLAELQAVQSEIPKAPQGYLRAMVYSRYPMNFKNEILVDAGADKGVVVGKAVLFGNIFIGKVIDIFPGSALVQTVFDGDFKMPVRVGPSGYDALCVGGVYPKAGSISKNASLANGDVVITGGRKLDQVALDVGKIILGDYRLQFFAKGNRDILDISQRLRHIIPGRGIRRLGRFSGFIAQ